MIVFLNDKKITMRRFSFEITLKNGDILSDIKSVGEDQEDAWNRLKNNERARQMIDFDSVSKVEYTEIEYKEVNPDNYKFEPSKVKKGWYVVTDLKRNIVTIFPNGSFNSDQKHTQLFDNNISVSEMATAMRELGEYLYNYHRKETGV